MKEIRGFYLKDSVIKKRIFFHSHKKHEVTCMCLGSKRTVPMFPQGKESTALMLPHEQIKERFYGWDFK